MELSPLEVFNKNPNSCGKTKGMGKDRSEGGGDTGKEPEARNSFTSFHPRLSGNLHL